MEYPEEHGVITHKRAKNICGDQVETSSSRGSAKSTRGIRPLFIADSRSDGRVRQIQFCDCTPASSGAFADNTFRSAGDEDRLECDTGRVGGSQTVFLRTRALGVVEVFLKGDVGVVEQALLGLDGDGIAAQVRGGFTIEGVGRVPVGRAWTIVDGDLFTHLAGSLLNFNRVFEVDVALDIDK